MSHHDGNPVKAPSLEDDLREFLVDRYSERREAAARTAPVPDDSKQSIGKTDV